MNSADWDAAISSEIFKIYASEQLRKDEQVKEDRSLKAAALKDFEALENEIKASPRLKLAFQKLQQVFANDPEYTSQVDSKFVKAVMMLKLAEDVPPNFDKIVEGFRKKRESYQASRNVLPEELKYTLDDGWESVVHMLRQFAEGDELAKREYDADEYYPGWKTEDFAKLLNTLGPSWETLDSDLESFAAVQHSILGPGEVEINGVPVRYDIKNIVHLRTLTVVQIYFSIGKNRYKIQFNNFAASPGHEIKSLDEHKVFEASTIDDPNFLPLQSLDSSRPTWDQETTADYILKINKILINNIIGNAIKVVAEDNGLEPPERSGNSMPYDLTKYTIANGIIKGGPGFDLIGPNYGDSAVCKSCGDENPYADPNPDYECKKCQMMKDWAKSASISRLAMDESQDAMINRWIEHAARLLSNDMPWAEAMRELDEEYEMGDRNANLALQAARILLSEETE
jgi:hypothetical protein